MGLGAHTRLISTGFILAYLGFMALLVLTTMSVAAAVRHVVTLWIAAPMMGAGLLLIVIAKVIPPAEDA